MTQATATKASIITEAPLHPSLATKDLAKARDWYADKLQWEPTIEPPGALVYEIDGAHGAFTIYESEFAGTAKNTVMNWVIPDVRAEVARLRDRGVTFEEYDMGGYRTEDGIMVTPDGGATAWFKDGDGNIVSLIEDHSAPAKGTIATMLAASDLTRAKAWYAEKLGFEPIQEFENVVANYQSGPSRFSVYQSEFAGTAKNTVAVWRLRGIRDEVARLRGKGVEFEEYDFGDDGNTVGGILSDADGDHNAWFTDSEGNILALAEDPD
jgi:catechol 2,3-dioxygenase-like lactoylglutathione lyase family enzyme